MVRAWRALLIVLTCALAGLAQQQPQQQRQQTVTELQKAVEEFRVQTRALGLRADSPSQGKNAKAGAKWHGRLFENFRNNFLDAVPHEIAQRGGTKGGLQRNQYGFNLSGPVVIPKLYQGGRTTFFSVTFEGVREKIARTFLRTIPTMPERAGDWGATVDSAGQPLPIYDPASTSANPNFNADHPLTPENLQYNRLPFAGNRIPQARLDVWPAPHLTCIRRRIPMPVRTSATTYLSLRRR